MDATVAISSDFFKAFSRLPKTPQSKVSEFVSKFQADPTSKGINFEKIAGARDPKMRSVRIDQKYRGIVLVPKSGSVFMLLWVDDHDDAYNWAKRHKCNINPQTGTIQIYASQEVEADETRPSIANPPQPEIPGVFDDLKDKELSSLGVPEEQLPLVRSIHNELELDALEEKLPNEAYEGLFYILAGSRFDEVMNERLQAEEQVDVDDFAAALARISSQGQFVVVDDEIELQKMLNAPLQQWRVFLHPSQRKLAAGEKSGPVRVLGGAGTGKTVVAMHRAKWLAANLPKDAGQILFTTFTKNLAIDIEENLRTICDTELMKRIEVVNLDQWVSQFLRKRNYDYSILYKTDNYWERALDLAPAELGLPDAFYREEWGRVIQPQSVETLEQYKRVSRIGRGTRLNRLQRVQIWPVFQEFRTLLARDKNKEVDDAYRDAAALLKQEVDTGVYASVIVDEAQDMGTQAFKLIREIVPEGPNDIFIVGDGHQRIYGRNKVVLSHCGIQIRGRARKLRINYRTTEEIRKWAVNLLEGYPVDDLDGGTDDQKGYKSLFHGEAPQLEQFDSCEDQAEFIVRFLEQQNANGVPLHDICIVARIRRELVAIAETLADRGVLYYEVKKTGTDKRHEDHVRLATMHRVKGLEFDEMVLASLNEGLIPLSYVIEGAGDPVELRQADLEERALLYVAITRAKKSAVLLSYGGVSPYLG